MGEDRRKGALPGVGHAGRLAWTAGRSSGPGSPEAPGDADMPRWTPAQPSVAMATQWAPWWVAEGSGHVELSPGGTSSALLQSRHF